MTVEQHDVIDFVSFDMSGNCVLTVSDHLSWDNLGEHLFCLQEKLNVYLQFIESGEIYQKYPNAQGFPIIISVVMKYRAPAQAQWFFTKVAAVIENAGFELEIQHRPSRLSS